MSRPAARSPLLRCSIFALSIATTAVACSDPAGTSCTRDDECASHFCKADGTCGPARLDAGPTSDAPADGTSGLCTPNHDGMITLAELPLVAGKMATFRIATNATFDTAGVPAGGGARRWDLSTQLANDADKLVALGSPTGQWWAASFPTATYASALSMSSDLIGVFHVDAAQVTLLGVVSPAGGTLRTELKYEPPAKILALPVTETATWMSTSTVSGSAQGLIVSYTEKYASRVDQVGTMKTPYGEFPVVRIATDLTRTSGFTTLLTKRTFAWTAECFGSVATVASPDNTTTAEFTNPAEVKRLVP